MDSPEPIEDHELAAGQVQWHSSEEDGGPDVGIMIGLGDGRALWFGELLNSEGRFGFTVFSPTEKLAVASYDEYDEVRELLEQHIAPALRRPSPVAESTPADATAVEAEREVWPSFNINECVRVKLRARGLEHLRREHAELNKAAGGALRDWRPPDTDAEGWTKMQLWCVMRDLGGAVVMGRDTPFETTIQLDPAAIRARTKES